jgi:hypothetical protein
MIHKSADGLEWSKEPSTMLVNPAPDTSEIYLNNIVSTGESTYLAAFQKLSWPHDNTRRLCKYYRVCRVETLLSKSLDGGETWSQPEVLETGDLQTGFGHLGVSPSGKIWYAFQDGLLVHFWYPWRRPPLTDIYVTSSEDSGLSWSAPSQFTRYVGPDYFPTISLYGEQPLIAFASTRYAPSDWVDGTDGRKGQIWVGAPGMAEEHPSSMPPVVLFPYYQRVVFGRMEPVRIHATTVDEDGIAEVRADYQSATLGGGQAFFTRDEDTDLWSVEIGPFPLNDEIDVVVTATDSDGNESEGIGYVYPPGTYSSVHGLRFFIEPVHAIGEIGLTMTSSDPGPLSLVNPDFWEAWDIINGKPSGGAGSFGAMPLSSWGAPGVVSGRWPDPFDLQSRDYLYDGLFYLIGPQLDGDTGPRTVAWWRESRPPVETPADASPTDPYQRFEQHYTDHQCDSLDVSVRQVSTQWSDDEYDDFIIFNYTLRNEGSMGDLDGMYAVWYFDFDLSPTGRDLLKYSEGDRFVYMYDADGSCVEGCPPWVGVSLLPASEPNLLIPHCIRGSYWRISECVDAGELEPGIDSDLIAGLTPGDHRFAVGEYIASLPPGTDTTFSFGLVYGANETELLENLDAMRAKYVGIEDTRAGREVPATFALHANYPNPFNPSTHVSFDVPRPIELTIRVFDVVGREVAELASGLYPPGRHHVEWDAVNLASGMYVIEMEAGRFHDARKVLLIR